MLSLDIILRDIDPIVINKLDEQARKRNVSRNEYMKSVLTNLAYQPFVRDLQKESILEFNRVAEALIRVNDRIENLEIGFERLYLFNVVLQSGMSLKEVDELLERMIVVEKD